MVLGIVVVVVVGFFVVSYFRNLDPGNTLPTGINTEDLSASLPTTYTVAAGDTLWGISEKLYGTGYNWVDLVSENNLADANAIETGQELSVPNVQPKLVGEQVAEASVEPISEPTPEPTEEPVAATDAPEPVDTAAILSQAEDAPQIEGDSYTVQSGDNLWTISVRAYGDGFGWTKISEANQLLNPDVIHAGNVLTIPR